MKEYKEVIDGYWRTRYLLNTNTGCAYEVLPATCCTSLCTFSS